MKVRGATYNDIPELLVFMETYHKDSIFSEVPFIRKDTAKVIDYYIASKNCYPIVAVNKEGVICGLLFVSLEPFFFNRKNYYASDLQFISNGAGMQLLGEFKRWSIGMGAERIIMGVSSGDPRADAFLELSGLEKTGNMYVLRNKSS